MKRENWGSMVGFILASTGSAIGLGNAWKFPYVAGQNGGGVFVCVYLLCVLLLGLPVMCSEMIVGRTTRRNVINALGKVELRCGVTLRRLMSLLSVGLAIFFFMQAGWLPGCLFMGLAVCFWSVGFSVVGWLSAITAVCILSYYGVIGGWIVAYIYKSFTNAFAGVSATQATEMFANYAGSPSQVAVGFLIFMATTAAIVLGGIRAGIERVCKVLMPSLFILLLLVIVRSVTLPGAGDGLAFFLKPDWSTLSPKLVLVAIGQAFFSLSLGMAITITYGSYLHRDQNVLTAAGWIGILDTLAAFMCGLAIFPAVFAMGLEPASGPSLIFNTLPVTFNSFPGGGGWIWCGIFFVMLWIAAVTSSASLLETAVTAVIERLRFRRKRCPRKPAVILTLVSSTALGALTVCSSLSWEHLPGLERILRPCIGETLMRDSWFDLIDNFLSNWVLPFVALGTVLLVGWGWGARRAASHLLAHGPDVKDRTPHWIPILWGILVKYICPIVIILVFLSSIKVFS